MRSRSDDEVEQLLSSTHIINDPDHANERHASYHTLQLSALNAVTFGTCSQTYTSHDSLNVLCNSVWVSRVSVCVRVSVCGMSEGLVVVAGSIYIPDVHTAYTDTSHTRCTSRHDPPSTVD